MKRIIQSFLLLLLPFIGLAQTAFPVSLETISQRLKDESVPTYGLYAALTGAWTNNQSIGGFSVNTGCNLWVESIAFSSNVPMKLQLATFNNELLPSGQVNEIRPFYTSQVVLPYNRFFEEHESIGLTHIGAGGDTGSYIAFNASGRLVSMDISKVGNPFVVLGTSISSGTGPTYGWNEYTQILIKYLESKGPAKWRKVLKAKGGWTSGNGLAEVNRGNVQQVKGATGIFGIELGTNDLDSLTYATNLKAIIDSVKSAYPKWVIWAYGPGPRQGASEVLMAKFRNAASAIVSSYNNTKIMYTNTGTSFSNADDTYFLTNDGSTSGNRVHWNDGGHLKSAQRMITDLEANNNAKLKIILNTQ